MTWRRSEARFQSHSPAHVLLDVQRQQLLGNAEGQRALFHLLSHKHPLVVHRLEPVDFAHRVLEHCEGQREQKVCVKQTIQPRVKKFCHWEKNKTSGSW